MKKMRTRIPSFLYADYFLRKPEDPKRLVILLHGYEQSGEKMMEKLQGAIPPDVAVLAPNGPFPLPRRTESGYRLGFSWYFWNPLTDEYYIDMEISVKMIADLVTDLGLSQVATTLIGFSQGGYLAPFIAQSMPQIDQVIGLGCEFLADEIEYPARYRVDAVHGAKDDVVSPENAKRSHQKILTSGAQGEFVLLAETGHRIDGAMQAEISKLLKAR